MSIRVGDRVVVFAHWHSFVGSHGAVTAVRPHLMVRLDEYNFSMRIEEHAVIYEPERTHLGGAE
jgi:hypothetical protein